jgi:hypothetical protein
MLLDESGTISNITTDNSFFDFNVWNQAANPNFVGVDIGPNAPGNVENNYFWNAKVFCAGPAGGNTDTGFRIGAATNGSQPNNTQFSHGGPSSCGRGFWIRGNTNGVDIGDMTFGQNFNSLYLTGGQNIHYHDIVDQQTSQPINAAVAGGGALLIVDNYNTSGTSPGPEINVANGDTLYLQLRNAKFTNGITTVSLNSTGILFMQETGPAQGTDATFCSVTMGQRQYDNSSQFCRMFQLGFAERSKLGAGNATVDELWPDSTAHRWKVNNNGTGNTTMAIFTDNLGVFASGGTVTPALYASSTNCSAVGTGANPSVASCTVAPAGSFSCAVAASGGTCVVNTTAVTANSEIFITQRSDTTTGTRLGVTCNATLSTVLPEITAVTAATSFTINLGTITTNPECFSYYIVN